MRLAIFFKVLLSEFRLYLCNHWVSNIPSHTIRLWYYRKVMGFRIGRGSAIFMGCKFDCARGFSMGENSVINSNCRIDSRGGIQIGSDVSISEDVIILTADHDIETPDFKGRNRKVVINNFVWIGTRATLLPGVIIGKGAVIAAVAVVTKEVEEFHIVAGIPAKFIGKRKQKIDYSISYRRLFQ